MANRVRVAIVGLGFGAEFIPIYQAHPDAEMYAITHYLFAESKANLEAKDTALGLREKISVFGNDYDTSDGTCIRDYIHVEDLARAHVLALGKLQAGRERLACNLGTGAGFSVLEVIETCRRVSQRPIAVAIAARREGDPPRLVSGGSAAWDLLGWRPQRAALEEIVADAWRFHAAEARSARGSS